MKNIICFVFLVLSFNTFAEEPNYGFYVGAGGSTGEEKADSDLKLKASSVGMNLGYRWVHWALEMGYSKYSFKSDPGQIELDGLSARLDKAEVSATSIDFMLRAFFLKYFTVGLGFSAISASHDLRYSNINNDPSNTYTFDSDATYSGGIFNVGVVLPLLRNLDFRLLYESRAWTSESIIITNGMGFSTMELEINFTQFNGQLVYYFN